MATAGSDSSLELGAGAAPYGSAVPAGDGSASGTLWLDGDILACRCPDCGAPMSVRLWLLVADCFRCGATVELTEAQEREAYRLLKAQQEARRTESREAVASITPTMARKARPWRGVSRSDSSVSSSNVELLPPAARAAATAGGAAVGPPAGEVRSPAPPATSHAVPPVRSRQRRVAAAMLHRGARARIRSLYEKGSLAVFFGDLLRDLPAWLVSLVVHAVALILLGMWWVGPDSERPEITLSTSISEEDIEGDQGKQADPKAVEFDQPGWVETAIVSAELGAEVEPTPDMPVAVEPVRVQQPVGHLPTTAARLPNLQLSSRLGQMFAGRDPTVRSQLVRQGGGTSQTEAAVARALVFLSRHQHADGHWSLNDWNHTPDCDDSCREGGGEQSDIAGTALALLPFLGAGQTHREGQYTSTVFKAIRWLVERQAEDGALLDGGNMYAHGQAAIALCEAYALSGDEQLREPAQMAVNFIVRAQHPKGGWRYRPREPGDTSVVGWQLMALKSAQMAYLYVPAKTFELAALYLDDAQHDKLGGRYAYQPGGHPTPTMTAEALLCRQYLGWPREHQGLAAGVEYLLDGNLPDAGRPNVYYWYYGTQVMHHFGGSAWTRWNARMRETLLSTQEKNGHAAGSWAPRGEWANRGGRIYQTALSACILEVYYRHMPLYRDEVLAGGLESFE